MDILIKGVRWGLIGAGDIARTRVAPAIRAVSGSIPYSVCRANAEKAASFAAEFKFKKHEARWQDLVADPSVDAVYIATPVYLHKEQAIAALEAGKHVLCEKPLTISAAEGEEVAKAAERSGKLFGVAYYRRFYPVVRRVSELIKSGAIGDVAYVDVLNFGSFDRKPGEPRYWLLEPDKSGGGPMMDMGCHRIDLLISLFGPVQAANAILENVKYKREVEDTALAHLHFKNGIVASVASVHAVNESVDSFDIYGSAGSIRIPNLNEGTLHLVSGNIKTVEQHPPAENVHQPLIEDFVSAIRDNRTPEIDVREGLLTTNALDLIYGRI